MRGEIELRRDDFREAPRTLYRTDGLTVTAFAYPSGVEALKLENRRGHLVVLPYLGQMIWAAEFDGRDLTMKHMFRQPKRAASIIDTYGCFMFHSGLLRNGCPGPDDTHALHGEMPCAPMDRASLVVGTDARGATVEVTGEYEYVQGFGSHYVARPSVRLAAHDARMTIAMEVTNLGGAPMDLMYMAHLNYAYVPGGRFVQSLPAGGMRLRDSVPAHVKPTAAWRDYTATLARTGAARDARCARAVRPGDRVLHERRGNGCRRRRAFPARASGRRRVPHRVPSRAIPACDALGPAQRGSAGRRVRAAVDLRAGGLRSRTPQGSRRGTGAARIAPLRSGHRLPERGGSPRCVM